MDATYPVFEHALADEPMSSHTTFKVGGPADLFVTPQTCQELVSDIALARERGLAYFVLGKGSDLLVSDAGYRGVVFALGDLNSIEREGDVLVVGPGASLEDVCERACAEGLGGIEFACGIPGSIGGACFMNAGAYDGCMADVLESVRVLMRDGEVREVAAADLALGYRTSLIRTEGMVVLEARLRLVPRDTQAIRDKMDDLNRRRREKQPLEYGSAGSTFKRPEGHFAGKLIMDAGLKGYRVGDAAVSEKHAGFVVNLGHATADDVRQVIAHVQAEVERQFGVRLEPEVRFLGF